MFVLLAMMTGLVGAVAGLVAWLTAMPHPYFVPLVVTEYQSFILPVNVASANDLAAIRAGGYFPRTSVASVAGQDLHLMIADLEELRNRSPKDDVVVYLSAYAGVDVHDDVFIMPGNIDPMDVHTRLMLRDVLVCLRNCPARHKLLVLDIFWPVADSRFGTLVNDAASYIDRQLKAVEDPRRLVLCSCSPGQHSLISEDLGRSVFGYYFEQALRGSADGRDSLRGRDGRVMVRELAELVQNRVDRWAVRNRATRQTPCLLGDGEDFELLALSHGERIPSDPLPEVRAYPAWLLEGWKLQDQWWNEGSYRANPQLLHRLAATLLRFEMLWRDGGDPERLATDFKDRLARFRRRLARSKETIEQPHPFSLAMLQSQGYKPDPAVAAALTDLLARMASHTVGVTEAQLPAIQAKNLDEFSKTIKGKPYADVVMAVWTYAAAANPKPQTLRMLNRILRTLEPEPQYQEGLCLSRLAELCDQVPEPAWPSSAVGHLLHVTDLGEKAMAQAEGFEWIRSMLDSAVQARHDAEVLFWARGYADWESARERLQTATAMFQNVLLHQELIREARRTLDEALAAAPAWLPFLMEDPTFIDEWVTLVHTVAQQANTLGQAMRPSKDSENRRTELMELLRRQTAAVQCAMEDIRTPLSTQNIERVIGFCRQKDAGPQDFRTARMLLRTPSLSASHRASLIEAVQVLSRRLVEDTFALDEAEDAAGLPIAQMEPFDRKPFQQKLLRSAASRAGTVALLLELSNLNDADPQYVQLTHFGRETPTGSPAQWAEALRHGAMELLPTQLEKATDLFVRDRLGWLYAPFLSSALADEIAGNPRIILLREENRTLTRWLADHYRYEVRDGTEPAFCGRAAQLYFQRIGPVPESFLQIFAPDAMAGLGATTPTGSVSIPWNVVSPTDEHPGILARLWRPDTETVSIAPALDDAPRPVESPLELKVTIHPSARPAGVTVPQGFLLAMSMGQRTYHRRITIPGLAGLAGLDVFLSSDPQLPKNDDPKLRLNRLSLRPRKGVQSFYLYVSNASDKARTAIVELAAGVVVSKKVTLPAKQVQRIAFEGPAAKLDADLPEVTGPLSVRLVDVDTGTTLAQKQVSLDLANPREYVAVRKIRFEPKSAKENNLTVSLKALGMPQGPPCVADLVLPRDRIPGFQGVQEGVFQGLLTSGGPEVALFAKNILLSEDASPQGAVYLTIDGVQRAFVFNTTFARSGDPITPQENNDPTVALEADDHGHAAPGYRVVLGADHAPSGSTLELSLGQMQGGVFQADRSQQFTQLRFQRFGLSPFGPDGALVFQATLRDWEVALNTTGLLGQRILRARLISPQGQELASVSKTVTFDGAAPDDVRFVDVPPKVRRTEPLPVQVVTGNSVSGVRQAMFYLGKPVDGKMPPTAATFPGQPVDVAKTRWSATIFFPNDAKGPTSISVELTNNVGLTTTATTLVELLDAVPVTGGTVRGTVVEGPRPQPGLAVTLADEKGGEKAKAKTGDDGAFVFENVAPGKYKVLSAKPDAMRKGQSAVIIVEPGKTTNVTVELKI